MEIRAFNTRYSRRKALRIKRIEEKEILDAINACQKKKLDKQTANDALKNEINSLSRN